MLYNQVGRHKVCSRCVVIIRQLSSHSSQTGVNPTLAICTGSVTDQTGVNPTPAICNGRFTDRTGVTPTPVIFNGRVTDQTGVNPTSALCCSPRVIDQTGVNPTSALCCSPRVTDQTGVNPHQLCAIRHVLQIRTELRSGVEVEVACPGLPVPNSPYGQSLWTT